MSRLTDKQIQRITAQVISCCCRTPAQYRNIVCCSGELYAVNRFFEVARLDGQEWTIIEAKYFVHLANSFTALSGDRFFNGNGYWGNVEYFVSNTCRYSNSIPASLIPQSRWNEFGITANNQLLDFFNQEVVEIAPPQYEYDAVNLAGYNITKDYFFQWEAGTYDNILTYETIPAHARLLWRGQYTYEGDADASDYSSTLMLKTSVDLTYNPSGQITSRINHYTSFFENQQTGTYDTTLYQAFSNYCGLAGFYDAGPNDNGIITQFFTSDYGFYGLDYNNNLYYKGTMIDSGGSPGWSGTILIGYVINSGYRKVYVRGELYKSQKLYWAQEVYNSAFSYLDVELYYGDNLLQTYTGWTSNNPNYGTEYHYYTFENPAGNDISIYLNWNEHVWTDYNDPDNPGAGFWNEIQHKDLVAAYTNPAAISGSDYGTVCDCSGDGLFQDGGSIYIANGNGNFLIGTGTDGINQCCEVGIAIVGKQTKYNVHTTSGESEGSLTAQYSNASDLITLANSEYPTHQNSNSIEQFTNLICCGRAIVIPAEREVSDTDGKSIDYDVAYIETYEAGLMKFNIDTWERIDNAV